MNKRREGTETGRSGFGFRFGFGLGVTGGRMFHEGEGDRRDGGGDGLVSQRLDGPKGQGLD